MMIESIIESLIKEIFQLKLFVLLISLLFSLMTRIKPTSYLSHKTYKNDIFAFFESANYITNNILNRIVMKT